MSDFLLTADEDDDEEESTPARGGGELIKVATGEEEEARQRQQELKQKDWTQRELAIRKVRDDFQRVVEKTRAPESEMLKSGFEVVVSSLDMKNLTIYLIAVEAARMFYTLLFDQGVQSCASLSSMTESLALIIPRTGDSNTRVKKKSVEAVMTVWKKSDSAELTQTLASLVLDLERKYKEKGLEGRISLLNYKLTETLETLKDKQQFDAHFGASINDVLKFVNKYSQNHRNAKVRERASLAVVQLAQFAYKTGNEQGRT